MTAKTNESHKFQMNPSDYIPKRFGLKSQSPPTIVLEYLVPSSGKLYHHRMKLPGLSPSADVSQIVVGLYKKHAAYLKHPRINEKQIEELVEKLMKMQSIVKTDPVKEEEAAPELKRKKEDLDYNELDMNKLGNDELEAHKKKMDEVYYKNYKDPKSKDFVYDIEKNFDDVERVDNSWDEDM